MDDRTTLHALVDQLSAAGLALARAFLEELVAAEGATQPGPVYHALELTDPLGTTVVTTIQLGPFATEAQARQAADALAAAVATRYLESGLDWEQCIQQVVAEQYGRLVTPAPPDDLAAS